jgi:hypothetical protein
MKLSYGFLGGCNRGNFFHTKQTPEMPDPLGGLGEGDPGALGPGKGPPEEDSEVPQVGAPGQGWFSLLSSEQHPTPWAARRLGAW